MATVTYEIDRGDFEKWLQENAVQAFYVRSCELCPLARYLSAVIGHQVVCGYEDFWFSGLSGRQPLPEWARSFIRLIGSNKFGGLSPSGSDAIRVLRGIPEDAAC